MNPIPIHDLSAPFALDQVKQRKGNFGQQLSYVETPIVIGRLNDALEGAWSFSLVETIMEVDEVIVRGRLAIGDTIREQFGGSKITRHRETGEMVSLADDLKSASSDALKKCATLAGVGLILYTEHAAEAASEATEHTVQKPRSTHRRGMNGRNGMGYTAPDDIKTTTGRNVQGSTTDRVSHDQITRIFAVAKDVGMPQKEVIALARDSFSTTISLLTPQQADDLISMIGQAA